MVSSEMGLLSDRSLLDFGMALSTAVLIAVMIKSAYLPRSLVYGGPLLLTQRNNILICLLLSLYVLKKDFKN